MLLYLQSRWRLEGNILRYYGLRNKPYMLKNTVRLTKKQCQIVEKLPCELSNAEQQLVKTLLGVQIVTEEQKKIIPQSLKEATFCKAVWQTIS